MFIGSLRLAKASEEELKAARKGKPSSARPTANAKSKAKAMKPPDSLALVVIPKKGAEKNPPPKKGAEAKKGSEPRKDPPPKKSPEPKKDFKRTQPVPESSPRGTDTSTSTPSSSPSVSHPTKRYRQKSPEEKPPAERRNKVDRATQLEEVPSLWVGGLVYRQVVINVGTMNCCFLGLRTTY